MPGVTASDGRGCLGIMRWQEYSLGSRWWWGMAWTSPEKVLLKEEGEQDLGHGNPASWCQDLKVWPTEQPLCQRAWREREARSNLQAELRWGVWGSNFLLLEKEPERRNVTGHSEGKAGKPLTLPHYFIFRPPITQLDRCSRLPEYFWSQLQVSTWGLGCKVPRWTQVRNTACPQGACSLGGVEVV